MVTIETNIAREFLEHQVMSRLGPALEHEPMGAVSWKVVERISREAVSALFDSKVGMEMMVQVYISEHPELLVRILPRRTMAAGEWLRTDDVAKLLGFSAPYVRALLDNEPFFKDKVRRTEGKQRQVLREHVEEWRRLSEVPTPEERRALVDDDRETPDLESPLTPEPELAARRKARAEARELRRKAVAG